MGGKKKNKTFRKVATTCFTSFKINFSDALLLLYKGAKGRKKDLDSFLYIYIYCFLSLRNCQRNKKWIFKQL